MDRNQINKTVPTLLHELNLEGLDKYNNFNPTVYKLSLDTFDLGFKLLSPT